MELPSFCDYCWVTGVSIQQDHLGFLHQYHPLKVKHSTAFNLSHISQLRITHWRMNLICVSKDNRWLFIAHHEGILCFRLHRGTICKKDQDASIAPHRNLDLKDCSSINQIRTGYLADEPVLITVHDRGEVHVFETDHLDRPPTYLENGGESTWSLSASGSTHLLAVGANSHTITVWDMTNVDRPLSISAHDHNIPAIAFDKTGNYIASASIDRCVSVHDALTGSRITSKRICSEWGWGVRWIHKSSVRCIPSFNSSAWQLIDQFMAVNHIEYESEDDSLFPESGASYSNSSESDENDENDDNIESTETDFSENMDAEPLISNEREEINTEHNDIGDNINIHHEYNIDEDDEDDDDNEPQNIVELYNGESHISLNESNWANETDGETEIVAVESNQDLSDEIWNNSETSNDTSDGSEHHTDLDDQLILYNSKHKLFLLSANNLEVLASVRIDPFGEHIVPDPIRAMNRLIFLEWIPEISSAVVATQTCSIAFIIRIVRNEYGSYRMIPEQYTKCQDIAVNPLAGTEEFMFIIFIFIFILLIFWFNQLIN
eukprot:gb/GECH01001189.1/.p1 GENE.gb/GECH01001189.1/~~gb/GECH01001189.1/.p1  ORF type:complete len:549 (+),score=107.53 gb/GECH01001189.1/:1-1647(+)